jgi:uncharacterized protein
MTLLRFALLVLIGFTAGLSSAVAGLASLVSYPSLLALGLSPVSANVTNTIALSLNAVGTMAGSGPELRGQGPRVVRFAVAGAAGGALGGALLLLTPASTFERAVPWLIGAASLFILAPRRAAADDSGASHPVWLTIAAGVVAIYAGYFGAAAGVVLLSLLLGFTRDSMPRAAAMKNLTLGAANTVAAIGFALYGPVDWPVALPLSIGFFLGGRAGPAVVRRAPTGPLRVGIAIAGLGLALRLGYKAYWP